MAKITKNQLKGIVKECLIEILSEGIGDNRTSQMSSENYPIQESRAPSRRSKPARRSSSLDNVTYNTPQSSHQKEKIDTLTSDPLMASIFADTQSTTMMSQREGRASINESSVALQGDSAARAMSQSDPEQVFGDAASNWAHLAFSDK